MTDDYLGAGIYLTDNDDSGGPWDLQIDKTGDVRTESGTLELRKDIAFRSAIVLEGYRGAPMTPTVRSEIEAIVSEIFKDEPRVTRLVSVEISQSDDDSNKFDIKAKIETVEQKTDLIFEV